MKQSKNKNEKKQTPNKQTNEKSTMRPLQNILPIKIRKLKYFILQQEQLFFN